MYYCGVYYYREDPNREEADLKILQEIRSVLEQYPFYGYRKVARQLQKEDKSVTEKQTRRIIRRSGLQAVYPLLNRSKARSEHKKYPYLLSGRFIRYPNEVGSTDLTSIKVDKGFVYGMAIIDWYSRKVLNWQVFIDVAHCALLLEDTIAQFGGPALFNTDQGCQCTADVFTTVLLQNRIQISMDGKNRALDNVFIERFWRSLKYEDIYLKRYETVTELKRGLTEPVRSFV